VSDDNAAERNIMARLRGLTAESSLAEARHRLQGIDAYAPERSAHGGEGASGVDRFLARAEANGMTCALARDRGEAVEALGAFVAKRQSQRRVVAGHDARLAALPWRDAGLLPRFGVAGPEDAVTVSYARCAVIESGSLALWVGRDNPALNNLLSDTQIILVDAATLVEALDDVWNNDPARERPRGLMLVSGPSSTADIGMQLVLGAHGPRAVHVVIVGVRDSQTGGDGAPKAPYSGL
jgi:L-lactate dehydrogenase complex protein LldG